MNYICLKIVWLTLFAPIILIQSAWVQVAQEHSSRTHTNHYKCHKYYIEMCMLRARVWHISYVEYECAVVDVDTNAMHTHFANNNIRWNTKPD